MTPFWIYVLVVSIVYFFYYAYNINKDLYGKKVDESNVVEEFDVQSLAEEFLATPVKEVKGGFCIGDSTTETPKADHTEPQPKESKFNELHNQMDEADVQSTGGMFEDELADFVLNQAFEDTSSATYRKSNINEKRQTL
jgi:hypothetical protein